MPPRFFNPYGIWIELIYSLVITLSCFWIYFKTRELYELTSYKGIRYFRNTFLFFGITSLIRLALHLVGPFGLNFTILEEYEIIDVIFSVMIFFSCLALINLVYSLFWKKLEKYSFSKNWVFYLVSIFIALISIISRIPVIFLIFQAVLFFVLIWIVVRYVRHRKTKDKKNKEGFSSLYVIYLLLFGLWIMSNILEFVSYFSPAIGLIVYGMSIIMFLIILLRVLKKLNKSLK